LTLVLDSATFPSGGYHGVDSESGGGDGGDSVTENDSTPLWFTLPPTFAVRMPAGTDMILENSRVLQILVQLRGQFSECPTLKFVGAVLSGGAAIGAKS
jgi:hypothetical protein